MTALLRFDPVACLAALDDAKAHGSARGYRHPLGFWHIAIPSLGAHKLRLHVWDSNFPREDLAMPQIHNHAFRFTSLVLRGAVLHTPFLVQPADGASREAYCQVRRVEQRGDQTLLVRTGEHLMAQRRVSKVYSTGHLYFYPENAYHLSESVGETPAMTLVVAEPTDSVTSCVLTQDEAGTLAWRKRWLSETLLSAFLAEASTRLAAMHALVGVLE